jgi:hypothetical protein
MRESRVAGRGSLGAVRERATDSWRSFGGDRYRRQVIRRLVDPSREAASVNMPLTLA